MCHCVKNLSSFSVEGEVCCASSFKCQNRIINQCWLNLRGRCPSSLGAPCVSLSLCLSSAGPSGSQTPTSVSTSFSSLPTSPFFYRYFSKTGCRQRAERMGDHERSPQGELALSECLSCTRPWVALAPVHVPASKPAPSRSRCV